MKQYNILVKLAKRKLLKIVFRLTSIIKGHITFTISQLLKFWNNYNYNDIINKPISSINKSLPATPMAGINTTPLVSSLHEILLWMLNLNLLNQKFIDTLLQINSKLSQNFDISNIISVANKVRKQPHERQHYEKKDTGLNNQQKQEENKSSEKSIEKNGSNKKKKKKIIRKT